MTEEIIIDDIDVSECERHCSDNLNNPNMCYSDMTETYSNCNPKEKQCYFYITSIEQQLKRAEQKLQAKEQVIEKIEQAISNFPSKGIQDIPQTQIECTQYFLSVSETKLQKILDIIHKAK